MLCVMCNMERVGLTASEEKSFENVDRRTNRRKEGRWMHVYTKSSPMSLRLRSAKKLNTLFYVVEETGKPGENHRL